MNKLLYVLALGYALNSALAIADIEFENAWVRALPPTQKVTAAYLTLNNRGDAPVVVTGARAPLAGRAEIHRSREIDGYVRMEQVERLEVPAGQTLDLSPGGTHIMLLELQRMPAPGESTRLCLTIEPGGEQCTAAEVRKSAPGGNMDHHGHH